MQESAAVAQVSRPQEFNLDINYIFVEKEREALAYLKQSIENSEYRSQLTDKITLVNDVFVNQIEAIIDRIKRRGRGNRAIFVLDQFGYAAVPFAAIRTILSQLKRAEIILTFATDSLIDYLSDRETTQTILENLGLELHPSEIAAAKQQVEWRSAIQNLLYLETFQKSGAGFYTPFFIRSTEAHRDYWLIHLSNHSKARDVMVGLHWQENTSFAHYGKSGLQMLGYDPELDSKLTRQPYLFDQSARKMTHESLVDQLPRRLAIHRDGIRFEDFFAQITNETPATSDIIKDALANMLEDRMIQIQDETGVVTREKGVRHDKDIIKPSIQRRLFLPGS